MENRIKVSPGTVIKRINRRLDADERLRVNRSVRATIDLGQYYIHDVRLNIPVEVHVDLEETARELGAIRDWETVEY
ncbi:MAG: hypothetical protein IT469_11795 [Pseudomonadales bacterium]|nr:hypothetical protein [Pseudomonadales bacterium]